MRFSFQLLTNPALTLKKWSAALKGVELITMDELPQRLDSMTLYNPIGAGLLWFNVTLPPKHIALDGSTVYINDYPELFTYYGYTAGGSGGSFVLPNPTVPTGASSWITRYTW